MNWDLSIFVDVVVNDDTVSGAEILGNLGSGGNSWQWSAKEQDFSERVSKTCHEISMHVLLTL